MHKVSTTLVYAVTLALFMLIVFALANAGIDPRPSRIGDFDPKGAATACFGLLGLYHAIAIIFFDEDDSPKRAKGAAGSPIPKTHASYTGFVRQAWYKVLSVGPIFAVFCTASVFIWHSFAKFPGTPGTVWGDYTTSPAPALTLFLLCWAAANIGLTFASIAEAFNRDRTGVFIAAMLAMFVVALGITVGFIFLPNQPTGPALTSAAIAGPLSLIAVIGARAWALVRVARYDANHPNRSPRQQRRQARFGHNHQPQPHYDGPPPHDMLEPGEKLLLHFCTDAAPEPQMLIATTTRVARASILASGRTFVLAQGSPGQLSGASSQGADHELMTTAHFRGRQDMRVIGGSPEQSRAFAEALTALARTGHVHR